MTTIQFQEPILLISSPLSKKRNPSFFSFSFANRINFRDEKVSKLIYFFDKKIIFFVDNNTKLIKTKLSPSKFLALMQKKAKSSLEKFFIENKINYIIEYPEPDEYFSSSLNFRQKNIVFWALLMADFNKEEKLKMKKYLKEHRKKTGFHIYTKQILKIAEADK